MDPIKIGWLGSALGGPDGFSDRIHRMAFDEAIDEGLIDRPVEFVIHPENGLPRGTAKNATEGASKRLKHWNGATAKPL